MTLRFGASRPGDVKVVPELGRVFWTDEGLKGVYSANLDGSDARIILSLSYAPAQLDVLPPIAGGTRVQLGPGQVVTGIDFGNREIFPSVVAIERTSDSPTEAASVDYRVTFSHEVTGVDASDFALSTTGISGASITGVAGHGNTYTVTVHTGSGDGKLRLDLVDDNTIVSRAGKPLGGPGLGYAGNTGGQEYVVDRSLPTVLSIVRGEASPTGSGQILFLVTFSESVTGVDLRDFSVVAGGGVSGASVVNYYANPLGYGASYAVEVSTGAGEGTLGLNLVDDDSIRDAVGNPLGGDGQGNGDFQGEAFTIRRNGDIRGTLWLDANRNEKRDAGEPGIPGMVVYLDLNRDGEFGAQEPSMVTDAQGAYAFENLPPGAYTVAQVVPAGWEQVFPHPGAVGFQRVSVASNGDQGNRESSEPVLSADGRYVAFESEASNFVPGDSWGNDDVFLYDRKSGSVECISVGTNGVPAGGIAPSISAEGRYVAFESDATNLVAGDTNKLRDIFVRDRVTGVTQRVNVSSSGSQANDYSQFPSMSGDGRYVAFSSYASNLVPDDTNGRCDVFVHDLVTGTTERVSLAAGGVQANGSSLRPSISADGRYVAFESDANNLVPGDTINTFKIFVYDRQTGVVQCASTSSEGSMADGVSSLASISADGRVVAFVSAATNLVLGDYNGAMDVFVRDLQAGTVERLVANWSKDYWSVAAERKFGGISGDGRYVIYSTDSDHIVPGNNDGYSVVVVYDRHSAVLTRVSVTPDGSPINGTSGAGAISADGRHMAFASAASNLVPGDTNGWIDVFVQSNPMAALPGTRLAYVYPGQTVSSVDFGDDHLPPTVSVTGPADGFEGVRGQVRTFMLSASDASPEHLAGTFTYAVDWGDGSPVETLSGPATLTASHVYKESGTYQVVARAIDAYGLTGPASTALPVTIGVAEKQGNDLLIGGTVGGDSYSLAQGAAAGEFALVVNGTGLGSFTVTAAGKILVFDQGGSDAMTITGRGSPDKFEGSGTRFEVNGTVLEGPGIATWQIKGGGGDDYFLVASAGALASGASLHLRFDGEAGSDAIAFTGGAGNESVKLRPGTVDVTGPDYDLAGLSLESVGANAGAGTNDIAYFYDSAGNDTFTGQFDTGHMTGAGFDNQASGFDKVYAYAIAGGADDQATLTGSAGDDVFSASPNYNSLSGTGYYLGASLFERIEAIAGAGSDVAYLLDSPGNDSFIFYPDTSRLMGTGFDRQATGFDKVYAYATAGGTDQAMLYDSAGNDALRLWPERGEFLGPGFALYLNQFDSVGASAKAGGTNDVASFYDSAGDDMFVAAPDFAHMGGVGFYNQVAGFDKAHGYATAGGMDEAILYDTAGNDILSSTPTFSSLSSAGFYTSGTQFEKLTAVASSGTDTAYLGDSAGNEVFTAKPEGSRLAGAGFDNGAVGFDKVYADGSAGGYDQATLDDTSGDDILSSGPTYTSLGGPNYYVAASRMDRVLAVASTGSDTAYLGGSTGNDSFTGSPQTSRLWSTGYDTEAAGFDKVFAFGMGTGDDQATLYDSAGDETLKARPESADFLGPGFAIYVNQFRRLAALATAGGNDVASFYDSAGNDTFVAKPDTSRLSGAGFDNQASGFDRAYGYATAGGIDEATLYDSAGNDTFSSTPTFSSLAGTGFYMSASQFEKVAALASAGTDVAYLTGSAGDDLLYAEADYGYLKDLAGKFSNRFQGFDRAQVDGSTGTNHRSRHDPLDYLLATTGNWIDD